MSSIMDEDLFAQIEPPRQIPRNAWPKIQRLPQHLRNREAFAEYYSPKMVSLGPIHHGEPRLELGEKYKLLWASMHVGEDRGRVQSLRRNIAENIEDLKNFYTEDAIGPFNNQQLARMLFLDGCALLQILKHAGELKPEPLNLRFDQLLLVCQDVLLLENQLPFRVLQLLSDVSETELLRYLVKFLNYDCRDDLVAAVAPRRYRNGDDSHQHVIVHHLLDELRRGMCAGFRPAQRRYSSWNIWMSFKYRNLKELKEAGIQIKRRSSTCPMDITFSSYYFSGELKLPDIMIDDTFAPKFLNLMAYEECPDFENDHEISSYLEFLGSLINHPDDVKELSRARVLLSTIGSDEKVAELLHDMSTGVEPNVEIYAFIRHEIGKHCDQKYKVWFAQAVNTYFSNPWSIIGLIAASVALVLTAIQTWFTVYPRG